MIRGCTRTLLAAAALSSLGGAAAAQTASIRDAGPGPVGRMLQEALARPHRLYPPDTGRLVLPRDSTIPTTAIVLARSVVVEAHVRGDVVAVGGDVFLHPGAIVDGDAIAIGGAVYPSLLANVRGQVRSHRDIGFRVDTSAAGEYALSYLELRGYPSPPLVLPGIYGLRLPTYERSSGASMSFGPTLSLANARIEIDGVATYRTQLGVVDPSLAARVQSSRRLRMEASAQRGTFTNDAWIWGDLVNSASVVARGVDTRNYFRTDRAQLTVHRLWEGVTTALEPFVGARWERAWSVRPDSSATGGPWSLFGRDDREDGILRFNPPVDHGHIASALAGTTFEWESRGVALDAKVVAEQAFSAPGDRRFTQATLDARLNFPTFGSQTYELEVHAVATVADTAPRQRWAYLGGSGTLPLLDLLSLGGDQLLYVESDYDIPIDRIQLPFVGSPVLGFRYALGAAGIGTLPDLHQNLAARLTLGFVRVQVNLDPATRDAEFGVGLAVSR